MNFLASHSKYQNSQLSFRPHSSRKPLHIKPFICASSSKKNSNTNGWDSLSPSTSASTSPNRSSNDQSSIYDTNTNLQWQSHVADLAYSLRNSPSRSSIQDNDDNNFAYNRSSTFDSKQSTMYHQHDPLLDNDDNDDHQYTGQHSLQIKERAFLVGATVKSTHQQSKKNSNKGYSIIDSLEELGRLAETAGLDVVGHTYQVLEEPNPRTYVGTGKVAEIAAAVARTRADTIIFDDELSPGQMRNIEKALGDSGPCLCDRTALILDIFSQRAATREGQLQVELAQTEYQLPRLTKMWSHLERQAGGSSGKVKGMGEKQIEIDKRLLRSRASKLRRDIDEIRMHRKKYRDRRADAQIPVIAFVGYTNAGKSTLLNAMTGAGYVF